MIYERHRFKTSADDYRPVAFPPPGPYWCSGYTLNENLEYGHAIIVAYLPKGEPLATWWPDASDVDTEERESITFTSRFPKPEWWLEIA